jgi:hypothetical protein
MSIPETNCWDQYGSVEMGGMVNTCAEELCRIAKDFERRSLTQDFMNGCLRTYERHVESKSFLHMD